MRISAFKTLVFLAISGVVSTVVAGQVPAGSPLSAINNVNTVYTYPGYYDGGPGAKSWASWINSYNAGAKGNNKIGAVYAYMSDLEFPLCGRTNQNTPSYNITDGYKASTSEGTLNPVDCKVSDMTFSSTTSINPIKTSPSYTLAPVYSYGSTFDQAKDYHAENKYGGVKAMSNTQAMIGPLLQNTCLSGTDCATNASAKRLTMVGIIDGRIDNGYLIDFNNMTAAQATAMANYVSFGTTGLASNKYKLDTSKPIKADDTPYVTANTAAGTYSVVGICNAQNISGVQMDLEPFSLSQLSQVTFYSQLAANLASPACHGDNGQFPNGKFFSVFAFANSFLTAQGTVNKTALSKLTAHNNFYATISLYDIGVMDANFPGEVPPPVKVGLTSSNQYFACVNNGSSNNEISTGVLKPGGSNCQGVFGSAKAVPHTQSDYKTAVSKEIANTIAIQKAVSNFKYRFAIPAAASAHEFQSWYTRVGTSCVAGIWQNPQSNTDGPCGIKGSGGMGNLIGSNPQSNAMLGYVKTVLAALKAKNVSSQSGYLGLDVWALSPEMEWSPNSAIKDVVDGWPSTATYVFFQPSTPPAKVIAYMQTNLGLNNGPATIAPSPVSVSMNGSVATFQWSYTGAVPAKVAGFEFKLYTAAGQVHPALEFTASNNYCVSNHCVFSKDLSAYAGKTFTMGSGYSGQLYAVDSSGVTVNNSNNEAIKGPVAQFSVPASN